MGSSPKTILYRSCHISIKKVPESYTLLITHVFDTYLGLNKAIYFSWVPACITGLPET